MLAHNGDSVIKHDRNSCHPLAEPGGRLPPPLTPCPGNWFPRPLRAETVPMRRKLHGNRFLRLGTASCSRRTYQRENSELCVIPDGPPCCDRETQILKPNRYTAGDALHVRMAATPVCGMFDERLMPGIPLRLCSAYVQLEHALPFPSSVEFGLSNMTSKWYGHPSPCCLQSR